MLMSEKKNLRNFVRDLLFIDIIQSTSLANPKNSKEINAELEKRWQEIFPNETFQKMGAKTIINHVADMRKSKLYDIRHCDNTRLGYYNEGIGKILLTAAESVIITAALYRSPSISVGELEKILQKIEVTTESEGAAYFYFLKRQIKKFDSSRKTKHKILPIVNEIWKNIMEREPKKIQFNYCVHDSEIERPILREKNQAVKFIVSPYFFAWENDELYLIANADSNYNFLHFKVSLIENLKILDENARPIREMNDYIFYKLGEKFSEMNDYEIDEYREDLKNSRERDRGGVTLNFPLDRYLKEHIYLSDGDNLPTKIEILFREDIKEIILTRFGLNERELNIKPIGEFWQNQKIFSATLTAQENDGLYQFLMQFCDRIKIISPEKIRVNLKKKLLSGLKMLE